MLLSAFLTFAPFTAFLVLEVTFLDFSLLDAFLGGYKEEKQKIKMMISILTVHTSFPQWKLSFLSVQTKSANLITISY